MADKKQPNNLYAQYIPERRAVQVLELLKEITDEEHSIRQAELLQAMKDTGEATTENAGTLAKSIDEILQQVNPIAYSEEEDDKYRIKYKGYEEDLLLKKLEIQEQKELLKSGQVTNEKIPKAPSITELQYVHDLSFAELDQIIQAVSFSSAVAPEEKTNLIGRLCNISSKYYKTSFYNREKGKLTFNPKGIYSRTQANDDATKRLGDNLRQIQNAINGNYRISFTFNDYNENGEIVPRYNHVVSPYYIVVYHDMYYLICGKEGKENAFHFRIDLMSDIALAEDEKGKPVKIEAMAHFKNLPTKDKWDPLKYMSEHLYMSYDQPRKIQVKIPTGSYTVIHDWFGENYRKCHVECEEGFEIVEVMVAPSMMVPWALQYSGLVEILDEEIRARIAGQIEILKSKYGEQTM